MLHYMIQAENLCNHEHSLFDVQKISDHITQGAVQFDTKILFLKKSFATCHTRIGEDCAQSYAEISFGHSKC
jgi:hypothetical protein